MHALQRQPSCYNHNLSVAILWRKATQRMGLCRRICFRVLSMDNFLSRIPSRYWGYSALALWGAIFLFLLRHDFYGLDEGAAKSLLLLWSVADNIASAVVTLGAPDLRSALFVPAGVLWTGSIVAPKIFALLFMACAVGLLYIWNQRNAGSENALLASGLLLLSPLTLQQIDTLSPGVFLLFSFALGAWLNEAYRGAPRPLGGWYFAQLFVCALSVSLHPAGLAYPLTLLWSWHKQPLDQKQKQYFFVGICFIVAFTLLVRGGWNDLDWVHNPFISLSSIALAADTNNAPGAMQWFVGGLALAALIATILKQHRQVWADFTGRMFLIAVIIGFVSCDLSWAMIALCLMSYFGLSWLLRLPLPFTRGFMHQRGAALLLLFVLSTLFMRADKEHYLLRQSGLLSDQDQLILALASEAERIRLINEEPHDSKLTQRIRASSQWPGRTMIACKCDSLPLPPAAEDAAAQLNMMKSITHLLFDPQSPRNQLLARNLAALGGSEVETQALQPGGVLLHFRTLAPVQTTGRK